MPMELLLDLAKGNLPKTIENLSDIDKLRVITAAKLVHAMLPPVGALDQKAQVLAITGLGRAALAMAYPAQGFDSQSAPQQPTPGCAEWPRSNDSYELPRDRSRTMLDS